MSRTALVRVDAVSDPIADGAPLTRQSLVKIAIQPFLAISLNEKLIRQASTGFAVVALISAAFVVVFTAGMMVICQRTIPYWDQWENLVSGRQITWAWLISQHNEHRLLFPRLIFIADAWLFHERNTLSLVANFVLQLATAILITLSAWRLVQHSKRTSMVIAGCIFALMFSSMQWENFAAGFQVQFFMVCFAAVASFTVFVNCRPCLTSLLSVFLLEILATFSLASGIIVPIVIVALSLWLRRSKSQTFLMMVAAITLIFSYFWNYISPNGPFYITDVINNIPRIGIYILNEIGNCPGNLFGAGVLWIHLIFGVLALLLFAALLATSRSRQKLAAQAEMPLFGIALFVIGMCIVTAVGRFQFGVDQATAGRYTTPVLLLWIALLLVSVSRLPRQAQGWAHAGLVLLALIAAIREPRFASIAVTVTHSINAAVPALLVPNGDLNILAHVYHDPQIVAARRPLLQAAHASVFFEPWSEWLNKPFTGEISQANLRACNGHVTTIVAVSDGTRSGWRITGRWAEPEEAEQRLVFIDATGRVAGLGITGLDAEAVGDKSMPQVGAADRWLGEILSVDPHSLTAYVLDPNDTPLCTLGASS